MGPFWTCAPRCVRASGISSVGDPPQGLGPRTVEGLWSTLRVQSHLHADRFFPEPRPPPYTHTHGHLGAGWQPRSWASDGQMSELLQVSRTGYKPAEPCGQVMMGSPGDTERQVSEVRGFRAGAGAQVPESGWGLGSLGEVSSVLKERRWEPEPSTRGQRRPGQEHARGPWPACAGLSGPLHAASCSVTGTQPAWPWATSTQRSCH